MDLTTFVLWCIEEGPFSGCDLDGASIQDKAVECGILRQTKFDPKKHSSRVNAWDYAEPGDEWFVFSPSFGKRLKRAK